MGASNFFTVAFALSLAIALATAADSCGQFDTVTSGPYTVYNNIWGQAFATSGSECFGVNDLDDNAISWHTSWTWEGNPDNVKAFTHAAVALESKPLSDISSMQTSWSWTYTGSDMRANVCYDTFTSSSAGGSNEYEIMVWLKAYGGVHPLSENEDQPTPIASPTLAGSKWHLFKGPNGSVTVYSFVADKQINRFSADIKDFVEYLIQNQGFQDSQYLTYAGAGTETFIGNNAKLTTSSYKLIIQ